MALDNLLSKTFTSLVRVEKWSKPYDDIIRIIVCPKLSWPKKLSKTSRCWYGEWEQRKMASVFKPWMIRFGSLVIGVRQTNVGVKQDWCEYKVLAAFKIQTHFDKYNK